MVVLMGIYKHPIFPLKHLSIGCRKIKKSIKETNWFGPVIHLPNQYANKVINFSNRFKLHFRHLKKLWILVLKTSRW